MPAGSVKDINVGANLVPAMLSGRVDATLGAYWNYEAIQLRQAGKTPDVIRVDNAGVPTYDELVVVVRENEIANQTNELRRFVQALGRGYQAVRADPAAGVDALVHANPTLNRKLQLASVDATLSSFFPARTSLPWGWQDPARWTAFGHWMLRPAPDQERPDDHRRLDQRAAGRPGAVARRRSTLAPGADLRERS